MQKLQTISKLNDHELILYFTKNNNDYIVKQIVFYIPSKHFRLKAYTYQLINNNKTLTYADLLNNKEFDISLKQNDKVYYSKADYTLYINVGNDDFKHEYKQVNQSFDRIIMNDVYTIFNDIELTDYNTEKTILNDVGNLINKLVEIIKNTYKNKYDSFGNTFYKNDKEIYSTIYYIFLQNSDLSIEKKIELIKQLFGISE